MAAHNPKRARNSEAYFFLGARIDGHDGGVVIPAKAGMTPLLSIPQRHRDGLLTNGAKAALTAWLAIGGREPGPLFTRIGKGERLSTERLSTQAVYFILQERGVHAGVRPSRLMTCGARSFVTC